MKVLCDNCGKEIHVDHVVEEVIELWVHSATKLGECRKSLPFSPVACPPPSHNNE
jgi:hypothetical protein